DEEISGRGVLYQVAVYDDNPSRAQPAAATRRMTLRAIALQQGSLMLLRTERLTKDYGSFRALDRLDLEVKPGEIFGLLGPNGSGKSTALRLLLGFLRPTSGRAWIDGHDCWHESVLARRQVGYLP